MTIRRLFVTKAEADERRRKEKSARQVNCETASASPVYDGLHNVIASSIR
jgi:hypothetical protein